MGSASSSTLSRQRRTTTLPRSAVAGGYLAWLVIPLVLGSDLTPRVKTALTAFLGSTPLLTKLIAIALLGRPTINFLKNVSPRRSCRLNAGWRPLLGHLQTSEWRRASSA